MTSSLGTSSGRAVRSIVYAATDRALEVPVAIAEYMPASIAQRDDVAQVVPRTPAQVDAFARGLKAFIGETRTLAQCDDPSLVRIVRLFEANATAYRVMPRYPTRRLLEVRQRMLQPPDEQAVRALLDALLGALEVFHRTGRSHGKVTPSNILLLSGNRPLLLSPGAAGRAIAGDRIDALISSPEPSFAPVEQIVESMDTPLPPSVDLYALAGVARYWISGQLPEPAFVPGDTAHREPFAETVQRLCLTWPQLRYTSSLVDTLESASSIYPAERPQSVAQMRARLGNAPPVAGDVVSSPLIAAPVSNDAVPLPPAPPGPVTQELDAVMAVARDPDPAPTPAPEPAPTPAPEPELLASASVTRIDDDSSARTAFTRQAAMSRRAAMSSAAVVLLLLLAGVYEFRQERQIARVLDALGISRGSGAGGSAAVADPVAPATPPIAADTGTAKSPLPEPAAADSPTSAATPAPPATATAPATPAGTNPATPAIADTVAQAEPPAVAQPSAPSAPPARLAQQDAPREPVSPRAACGARTEFSLYRCMQTQCSQRRWASHAQCERLRAYDSVD